MVTEKNRINFFCSLEEMDKLHNTFELEGDGAYFDSAFTVDVIDFPFLLFYSSDRDACRLQINTRFDQYKHEEGSGKKEAELCAPKNGGLQGQASEDVQQLAAPFMVFCMKLAKYAGDHGLFKTLGSLDPEKEGILLEAKDSGLEYRVVSGSERPDLMCMTLSGNVKMTRPYEEDFRKRLLLDVLPLDTKEKMAESGNAEMMEYMFNYYMGNSDSPHAEIMSASKQMKRALGALSGENDDQPDDEEVDTRNPEKAFYWLKKIAETGDAGAMNALSIFYTKGFGTERDFRKAAEWRKKAADQGLEAAEGQEEMLLMIAETKEQAEAGNTEAQAKYAGILALLAQDSTELGSDADSQEAFQWAQKSAAKYDLDGIFTLARFYADGAGTPKDAVKAFRLFERAANKGHVPSQARLGQMYFQGEGTEENPQAAYEWSRKAAAAGDMNGMSNLAACYLLGKGVDQNRGKAVEWLQKAAELGDESAKGLLEKLGAPLKPQHNEEHQPQTVEEAEQMAEQGSIPAMKLLANYYINRPGGKEDLYEAQKWAKKAADLGDKEAKQLCAQLESTFNGETISFEDAKRSAESEDPGAQKILADYYATGYKTERDLVKALYWMKKAAASGDPRYAEHAQGFVDAFSEIEAVIMAADRGDAHAQAQLAEKYMGIFQNYPDYGREKGQRDAFEMANLSASSGDSLGLCILGMCYENGYGTEVDFDKAFDLYKQSAELGNPRGELSLSQVYLLGRGTETDPDAAVDWLEKAELHGNPETEQARSMYPQIMFGMGLDKMGDGVNSGGPNPELGVRLVKKAAELGHGEAQGTLGMLYLNGNNIEQDFEAGIEWLRKAADSGNRQATSALVRFDRPEAYNAAANKEFAKKDQADKEKVFRLMKHAAEGGLAASQSTLGFLYMNGYGVLPDYQKGMEWFRKAADQGNENAVRNIQKYESADGLFMGAMASFAANRKAGISDGTAAYELLKKAVEAGSPEAMNMMGVFLAEPAKMASQFGVTVEEDWQKAETLFKEALELKPEFAHAENNLKKLADLEEAEKIGREPNPELKWSIALKKMNSGANSNTQPANAEAVSNKEAAQNSRDSSEIKDRQKEEKPIPEESKPDQEDLSRKYQENGKCRYCGGDFKKGIFGMKCTRCGKKKDY